MLNSEGKDHGSGSISRCQHTFLENIVSFSSNRRFYTTSEGYIGLGPAKSQRGNIISVLLGLRLPITLHPCENGNFKVVGTCYCHGIMSGEALLGPLPDDWQAEVGTTVVVAENEPVVEDCFFVNKKSRERTQQDPRLWELPPSWKHILNSKGELQYENIHTRETTWVDPRVTSEELEKRGVKIKEFAFL